MRTIIACLFCLGTITTVAQSPVVRDTIKGIVADSLTGKALPGATVRLHDYGPAKTIKTIAADERGAFEFSAIRPDSFSISIEHVGYREKVLYINAVQKRNLGIILLTSLTKQLENVVVTATKPLVRQEIDRMSYDVQADPENRAQNVLDMLRKVPLVSLDGDENVLLKGSGNYRIFINGKPSALLAQNPREALRAMPANTVLRIEIITIPPAKYDAEGLAGIINIVLVKRLKDGYNGSIGANYNNTVGTGQSFSLTAKAGKFGIAARSYMYQDFWVSLPKENTWVTASPVYSRLLQNSIYSFKGNYTSANAELSYEADSLDLFTTTINLYKSRYDDQTWLTQQLYNAPNNTASAYQSLNINPQRESGVDINVNYQRGFKKAKDRFLTFSYQLHYFPNRQTNETTFAGKTNYNQADFIQENSNGTRENTVQLDYTHPAKKFTVEAGVKAILRRNYSDFANAVFDSAVHSYIPVQPADGNFTYRQNVYGLYNSWQFKLKAIELKTGLRLEATNAEGRFSSAPSGFTRNYANVIPVISLLHRFKQSTIGFGFTQRILRPGIYQLNPFVDKSNPQFIRSGNPSLKAVLNNNFELSFSHYRKGNITLTLSYAFANNEIQQVTTFTDTSSYSSYQNIGKSRTAALNASVSYPFSGNLSFSLSSSLTYVWLQGTFNAVFYRNEGIEGYAYSNINY